MIDENIIRELVPDSIYRRGLKYYHQGYIKRYFPKVTGENEFQINAQVSGTRDYEVELYLEFYGDKYYIDGVCSCPYDWGEYCKHEIAVLYKFFSEDYNKLRQQNSINYNYQKLIELTERFNPDKKPKLEYRLKGVLDQSLSNFKLIIISDQISDSEMNDIIEALNGDLVFLFKENIFERNFTDKELQMVEKLSSLDKTKGREKHSLLLTKNEDNFEFLLKLIENYSVVMDEIKQQAESGKTLYPKLKLTGDIEKIKLMTVDPGYPIYSNQEENLFWSVIENKVHPVDLSGYNELDKNIDIPEKRRGEFLFEMLPVLQKNTPLEIKGNLTKYQLIKEEPDVSIKLDYSEEKILCDIKVNFSGEDYCNTELLGLDMEKNNYIQSEEDPYTWYTKDIREFSKIIRFLEDYNFTVRPDRFILKNESDIQNFITDGLPHIPEEWEVKTTDSFDEIEIKNIELEPIIEFSDGEGINWFDFKISYNLGGKTYSRQELKKMISYNRTGEAYVKIDKKYFVINMGEKEKSIDHILDHSEKSSDGEYRSRYHNLLYYRNMLQKSGIKFEGSRVFNELDKEIGSSKAVKKKEIPSEVKDILRDYQKEGFYWLNFLQKFNFGGILADDMGLGKTLQMLTLIKSVSPQQPVLVVCPRTLIYNWKEESDKFFDNLETLVYYGTPDERDDMRNSFSEYELIISSYSVISRDIKKINQEKLKFSLAILDEAQHIKNHRTKRAKSVKNIKADTKLALTGTPLENSAAELWSIFDYLMPGYLGNYSYFNKNFYTPISKNNDQQKMKELKERVAPFILRRRKEEVLAELPEKIINIQPVNMTQLQEDSYQMVLDEVKNNLKVTVEERGFERSHINVLTALTKLRQICNHPSLVLGNEGLKHNSGKLDTLEELVNDAVSGGHKVIVFSQFVKMLKLIEEHFEKNYINYEYLDGSTRNRMERVNNFNNNENIDAFLISLKAGGIGLNLTSADIVIHVDPWWNPMVERQASDRAHRIGQENRVIVYKLITKGTVEEKMLKLQQKKQDLFDNIIENNVNPISAITWEDIQELLS
ncbi:MULTISPECIES: SNF2-related protein [unclassified Halanaerobium]|uniref:SNF2-related protein n=1 Tax=unclassified Halanaerobium TaxID=2641197 RepID=UPI000DF34903|nr:MULTISPECIES: SNF2-related protein [unclassified Halanaerobium]RCW44381.1 helicase-like protein [Halanaerobium sp. MA284_MarDTE_T2]RCW78653.1 helicase-like protein [Halanaerobium sp. DL-01]